VRGLEAQLWRSLRLFRIAALGYALFMIARDAHLYRHPTAAWVVGGIMVAWTAVCVFAYGRRPGPPWPLLIADLLVMGGCMVASLPITGLTTLATTHTLPAVAVAGTVMAWAIAAGRYGGAFAAAVIGVADVSMRSSAAENSNGAILLLLSAVALGYAADLIRVASQQLAQAAQKQADAARRDAEHRTQQRLARSIHDSVLQVLSLMARNARDLGGDAAQLGQLAGEQETALRQLINRADAAPALGLVDLRQSVERFASVTVTVATPATPVVLPAGVCDEVAAAIGSALDNVDRHAGPGALAWVLVESEPDEIVVSVRDDGVGIAPGRLDQAAAAGRLGVAESIRARMRDIGGEATITSEPGHGTEVELRLPTKNWAYGLSTV
jgi:signal transduction histidine kinase